MTKRTKRFLKVIEWDKKFDSGDICVGIISFLIGGLLLLIIAFPSLCVSISSGCVTDEMSNGVIMFLSLLCFGILALSLYAFFSGIGHGRKVYWEEQK